MPVMMIFAVVVIALIVVAGIFAGQQLLAGGNASTAQQEAGEIAAKIQSVYGTNSDYCGLTTASAEKMGAFPQNMIGPNGPVDPFGGAVYVYNSYNNCPGGQPGTGLWGYGAFQVQFNGLSDQDCISLATSVPATWVYATYDLTGNAQGGGSPLNTVQSQPPTPAQAQTQCRFGLDSVTFLYVYGKD